MAENIIKRDITHDISKSYLEYSLDVIVGRALPDVRDGLKPVHRRILYAMYETGNTSTKAYKKSARTVGEVLGKYHPHGDSSVYDAMVRLAQDFSVRYPFVDGHGNFGSVDGDSAAAMRYTEARMSKMAEAMMEDIDKDTIDMNKNYDETLNEPSVLPSKLPNLLLNGTEGIAVGFASKMPTHNITEVMNGILAYLDNPDITTLELMKYIKGPDFPTGCTIQGTKGIYDMYTTGRGNIIVRSDYTVEPLKNGKSQIVFINTPYQVNKSLLVEKINNLIENKIINDVSEVRDESSVKDGTRVVVELKKTANSAKIIRQLYKKTDLECNFPANMTALVPTKNKKLVPKTLLLKDMIFYFVEHRKEVVTRKYNYLLKKAEAKAHITEGLIKATNIIDKVVATIRGSKNKDDAKFALIKEYEFSEPQAIAILNYKLSSLCSLEIQKLEEELKELEKNIKKYTKILSSEKNIIEEIKKDCNDVIDAFGDDRYTKINYNYEKEKSDDEDFENEDIEDKEMIISITNTGYIKSIASDIYNTQSRGGKGVKGINNNNLDIITKLISANKRNLLLCFGSDGKMYKLPVADITESNTKLAKGQYLNTLLEANADVKIVAVLETERKAHPEGTILMFSSTGGIKRIKIDDLMTNRKSVIAIKLKDDEELVNALLDKTGKGQAFIATNNGYIICFDYGDIMPHGRNSGTSRGIKLRDGDYVVNADEFCKDKSLLTVTNTGIAKKAKASTYRIQSYSGKGTINYKTTKDISVVSVIPIDDDNDILVVCNNGKFIRVSADSFRNIGRTSKGSKLVKLDANEEVSCITAIVKEENQETPTE